MEKVTKNIPLIKEGELWSPLQPYTEKSVMEVIGKPLTLKPHSNIAAGWEEAANILRTYDNPRFETARYLIVSGGKIAEHIAVSSQIPASTNVYPHTWMLNRLRKQLEATNSSVLFSHNHPSGIDTDKNIFACYSDAAGFIAGVKSIPQSLFWKNQNAITEDIKVSSKNAGAASGTL